ncbi:MAG: hypothetical protein RL757_1310 [Bacteroidota bacterium]|jgi:hypothetical protein
MQQKTVNRVKKCYFVRSFFDWHDFNLFKSIYKFLDKKHT